MHKTAIGRFLRLATCQSLLQPLTDKNFNKPMLSGRLKK